MVRNLDEGNCVYENKRPFPKMPTKLISKLIPNLFYLFIILTNMTKLRRNKIYLAATSEHDKPAIFKSTSHLQKPSLHNYTSVPQILINIKFPQKSQNSNELIFVRISVDMIKFYFHK